MQNVPHRPALLTFCVLLGAFLAGPILGMRLATWLAPGSGAAGAAAVLVFPLAFVIGLTLWFGRGVSALLAESARGRRSRRGQAVANGSGARAADTTTQVPPGYGPFPLLGGGLGAMAGVLVALVSDASLGRAVATFGIGGVAYGLALRTLAHHGWLPFPDPE